MLSTLPGLLTTTLSSHPADAHKPYAWASYLGLYAVHWVAFLLVMGAARCAQLQAEGKAVVHAAAGTGNSSGARLRWQAAAVAGWLSQLLLLRLCNRLKQLLPCVAMRRHVAL